MTNKPYRTLLLDPPWPERGGGKIKRGADRHYPLMSVKAIMALPVADLLDHEHGAHVYLWATNNYLRDAFRCLDAWGLKYITTRTWPKPRIGLGQYYRGQTEHCLFARTKKVAPYRKLPNGKRAQGATLLEPWIGKHSAKPPQLRLEAELVSHGPYLELFAREPAPGWDALGNEVGDGGDDIAADMVSLAQQLKGGG